jgi:AAA family ATP:ADP antiporter
VSRSKILRLFADVRAGEATTALLLAANLFFLLFGYYLLKTLREPLILGSGGAEVKSYAAAFQALLLVAVSLAFGWLAERVHRMKLILYTTGFFAAELVLFFVLHLMFPEHKLTLGVAFFVWVGCFNVMIVAQFWAFANDVYTREQGERLFALVAGGSALGAVGGAHFAKPLYLHLGAFAVMLIVAAMLLGCLALTWFVHARESGRALAPAPARPLEPTGSFRLLWNDNYLLLVGALSFVKNWVNTTGEYILDRRLLEAAHARLGADATQVERFIAAFKSDYFTYVNAIVLALQLIAVSRLLTKLKVRGALFVLPIVSALSYGGMAFAPLLGVIFAGKIAENSLDYSLQKTVEQTLFLVTTRDAKYKVKAIVDTVLVRMGDVASAALVWCGMRAGLSTLGFIFANLTLVATWIAVVALLARAHAMKTAPAPYLAPVDIRPAPAYEESPI